MLLFTHIAHAQPDYSPGQILVKFRNAKPALAPFMADRYGVTAVEPLFAPRRAKIAQPHPLTSVYRVHLSGDPLTAAADYATRPDVVYAQPNYLFTHQSDDPHYAEQSSLQTLGWEKLYQSLGPSKKQIVVAIIDSGVDYDHEDLRDNIWHNDAELRGTQGVDDDGNGYIDDIRGWDFTHAPGLLGTGDYLDRDNDPRDESSHGTGVAGIVAAATNNGVGIAGIAPDARIMALRAGLNRRVNGNGGGFLEEDDLAAAILYAVENGAQVINMSWGGPERTFILTDVLQYAHAQGIVLVAAAGNSGEALSYPAAHHATLAIGATRNDDQLAYFSSRGAALDLVAPGVGVLSTYLNNHYQPGSGTSYSTPHVSGLIALILSRRPELSPQSIRGLLIASAIDLGRPGHDNRFGGGRVSGDSLATRLGTFDSLTVAILSPNNDQGAGTAFDIRASVSGAQAVGYRLSYGLGHDPQNWTRLASDSPSAESIRHTWDVSDLAETDAVLRLEADLSGGGVIEDRVRVAIQKTGPAITNLVCGDVLEADLRVFECRWETDQRAHGGMAYRVAADFDTLYTGLVQTTHRVVLPHTLPAGAMTFHILADGENGAHTTTPARAFDYAPLRVPQNGFSEIDTLPGGYLPDRASDFDRDGKLEIALRPHVKEVPLGPVHIYELDGTFSKVFQSDRHFEPRSIGDFDNDGRDDLLGDDLFNDRVMLFTGTDAYPTLEREWPDLRGGQFADVDGDGIPDIVANEGQRRGIRVIRSVGGAIREDFLPALGRGVLGPRFVVSDFDGDGHRDILAGDSEGDLWMYEYRAGSFDSTWVLDGRGNAQTIGGGADFDADGAIEFAVARAYEDFNNSFNGFWELEIYSASADTFAREWAIRINGVAASGNGISVGDGDGDGRPDLLVCTPPHLYAFRADAANRYRPFWHAPADFLTCRPLIADLNKNSRNEVIFNFDGAVRIVERDAPPSAVPSPQIIRARALGPTRVELNWTPVPDASAYQIYRAVGREGALDYFAEIHDRTAYIDELLTEGTPYRYQIVAADMDSRSGIVSLVPNARPEVVRHQTPADDHIQLFFSEAMGADAAEPSAYLLAGVGQPTSVILDRQNTRAVLAFPTRLPTPYTLTILDASDATGTPLGQTTIAGTHEPSLLARADANGNGVIDFPDFIAFARAFQTSDPTFDFDGDGTVGFSDFLAFARIYGRTVNSD